MTTLDPSSPAARLYAAANGIYDDQIAFDNLFGERRSTLEHFLVIAAEHEKIVAERLAAITAERDRAITCMRAGWVALAMIRDAVETLGPVGVMRSSEIVCCQTAPTPEAEADEIIAGLQKITAERDWLRLTLEKIASISHCGGLVGLNDPMPTIRRMTIKFWDRTGSIEDHTERCRAALNPEVKS